MEHIDNMSICILQQLRLDDKFMLKVHTGSFGSI